MGGRLESGSWAHQLWLSLTLTGWEFPNSRHGLKFWEAKNQTEHEYPSANFPLVSDTIIRCCNTRYLLYVPLCTKCKCIIQENSSLIRCELYVRETNYITVRQWLAGWQLWEPLHRMTQLGPGRSRHTEPFGAGVSSSLHIKAMILDSAAGRDSKTGAVILNLPPLRWFPFHYPDLEGIPMMEQSTPCLSPLPSRVACCSRAWLGPPSVFLSPAAEAEDNLYLPPFEKRGWAEDRTIINHPISRAASWGHVLLYINIIPSSHMIASKTKYDKTNHPLPS